MPTPRPIRKAFLASIPLFLVFLWFSSASHSYRPSIASFNATITDIENTVVIPSYKEAPNLRPLIERIFKAVSDPTITEVVVIDDNSQDGTEEAIASLRQDGYNVVLNVRTNESGLSSAVLKGLTIARGAKMVVMDADLQHPPEIVPAFFEAMTDNTPMVLGVRASVDSDWPWYRRLISSGARLLARPLTRATDPMTGFFGLSRKTVNDLAEFGKILSDHAYSS